MHDLVLQKCISALTEEDDLNERDADSEAKNIEQKITHFTDLARWIFGPEKAFTFYSGIWKPSS